MSDVLRWNDIQLSGHLLEADRVTCGANVHLVMSKRLQYTFLDLMFPAVGADESSASSIWLESHEKEMAGSPEFCLKVGSIIRHRGLMANLSLRENLLLPFLFCSDHDRLQRAGGRVDEIAEFLGLEDLDRQSGERSSYDHALLSLGHCMLQEPDVIIAQEVHLGISSGRWEKFAAKASLVLKTLGSGLLYLSELEHDGSSLKFVRTHKIVDDLVPEANPLW